MKSRYQTLLDQYNNRNNCKQGGAATQIAPQKNAISMIFGAFFIFIYIQYIIHGNFSALIFSYLLVGFVSGIGTWAQCKYFNKVGAATMKRMYQNYTFVKAGIAWLPAIFLNKVQKWVYA